jgi:hypothetical protein
VKLERSVGTATEPGEAGVDVDVPATALLGVARNGAAKSAPWR